MGPKEELQPLAESIAKMGQVNPAVTLDGKILDGRRRAAACVIAGVELRTTPLPDGIDPVEFVVAQNLR
jgi:ParB-like chromosome segregation protein Spo0J